MANSTTNEFQNWDGRWRTETYCLDWLVPDQEVSEKAHAALDSGAWRSLGLAYGVGRHTLALADIGLKVDAFDVSRTRLAEVSAKAEIHGISVSTNISDMTELPFVDGSYDFLVSWNVIYHGDKPLLRQPISEIYRVLRPGGTIPSRRNAYFGSGPEVSKNFWVDLHAEAYKAHPHYFCDARQVVDLLTFDISSLVEGEQRGEPGDGLWHIVAERT